MGTAGFKPATSRVCGGGLHGVALDGVCVRGEHADAHAFHVSAERHHLVADDQSLGLCRSTLDE